MIVSRPQVFTAKYQSCCRKEENLSQGRPRDCIAPTETHGFQNKECKLDSPHNPDSNQSIGQQNCSRKTLSESERSQITLHRSSSTYIMGSTRVKKRRQLQLPSEAVCSRKKHSPANQGMVKFFRLQVTPRISNHP